MLLEPNLAHCYPILGWVLRLKGLKSTKKGNIKAKLKRKKNDDM